MEIIPPGDTVPTNSSNGLRRVTLNLIPNAEDALIWLTEHQRLSKTDVINRELQRGAFLERVIAEGGSVLIADKDGKVQQLKFL